MPFLAAPTSTRLSGRKPAPARAARSGSRGRARRDGGGRRRVRCRQEHVAASAWRARSQRLGGHLVWVTTDIGAMAGRSADDVSQQARGVRFSVPSPPSGIHRARKRRDAAAHRARQPAESRNGVPNRGSPTTWTGRTPDPSAEHAVGRRATTGGGRQSVGHRTIGFAGGRAHGRLGRANGRSFARAFAGDAPGAAPQFGDCDPQHASGGVVRSSFAAGGRPAYLRVSLPASGHVVRRRNL